MPSREAASFTVRPGGSFATSFCQSALWRYFTLFLAPHKCLSCLYADFYGWVFAASPSFEARPGPRPCFAPRHFCAAKLPRGRQASVVQKIKSSSFDPPVEHQPHAQWFLATGLAVNNAGERGPRRQRPSPRTTAANVNPSGWLPPAHKTNHPGQRQRQQCAHN